MTFLKFFFIVSLICNSQLHAGVDFEQNSFVENTAVELDIRKCWGRGCWGAISTCGGPNSHCLTLQWIQSSFGASIDKTFALHLTRASYLSSPISHRL